MNIHDACDYVITKMCEGGAGLNMLRLQKLLYYAQAWRLAFENESLFDGKFQAWIHGPVSRDIYDRFSEKSIYAPVAMEDRRSEFNPESLDPQKLGHIDSVLEVYGQYSGAELSEMTHLEDPWIEARKGYRLSEKCDKVISEETMAKYYSSRLPNAIS